jgi:UDP-glucose 4-epimerase
MKTILITGGSGFIGSHLAEKYVKEGYLVKVLDDFSNGKVNNIRELFNYKNFKLIKGDITDKGLVRDAVRGVDVVFHLAAQVHVDRSIIEAERTFEVNAQGTMNVLETVLQNDVEALIYASSSEVYGSALQVPMNESHPLNPASPYAASKVAADRMCFAYWNTYKLPVVIVRCFNTYGARQTDSGYAGAIPLFIKRVLQNLPPIIYGDGNQERDYMYIKDTVNAYDLVLKSCDKLFGKAINFGTGKDTSINEIANIIIRYSGNVGLVPLHAPERPGEVKRLCADIGFARQELGFEPQYNIEKGLDELMQWYERGNFESWTYT